VNDLFVVHQHAVRDGVVIAAMMGIRQLVHELVGIEAEFLHSHGTSPAGRTLPACRRLSTGLEPASDALALAFRHARRQVGTRLLSVTANAEQEERVARLGGDPVRVTATGVQ